ncbi:NDP-hexose 2,3-dehydratase family protein [Streptomyces sp. PTM05]|uniref:NDP-hexose 2,3-dehydratase family protein n=1 Tax=Streptantibioticus parmotrematis TaxID=2873249 RepID=A0ABS7QTB3_9ACTN|nr:NDP-hexose 2,3-dehydratase family protein [Streptantibioticus parmotrematis]MBY8886434.1 NDP-hexose 2,3-dehydratase family protein [Streptantibioticus parmotrematis]
MTTFAAPPASPLLTARDDAGLPARFARSAQTTRGVHLKTEDFPAWLAARGRANVFKVEKIPFDELDGWSFEDGTGNLVHRSGRFFTVEGMRVTSDTGPYREWHQPIIKQPEVGILGILVKEFDGVLHCLMQAKMEPGNRNLLQLSPTVQATRSNYTKVHQGADVKYIEYFLRPELGRVLTDVLQSEHGSWFFHKSNRNMIVEAHGDVPLHDDFCWLTFGQISELLHQDNVVNMDSRTVLSTVPMGPEGPRHFAADGTFDWAVDGSFAAALDRARTPDAGALHSDTELLSWFTAQRSAPDVHAERVPLTGLPDWTRDETRISHDQGRFFDVVAVKVEAGSREVARWTQPLIEPVGPGVCAFLARSIEGVLHVLVNARVEGGFLDTIELSPTVQCTPGNHEDLPDEDRPPFLDLVLNAEPARVRYEAVHSEEGGRFLNAEARYLVVEVLDGEPGAELDPPEGFRWVTPGQLASLVRHGHYVNVQARTLLACLNAMGGGRNA